MHKKILFIGGPLDKQECEVFGEITELTHIDGTRYIRHHASTCIALRQPEPVYVAYGIDGREIVDRMAEAGK